MPRSGGKSPWGSVVITQRGQGPVTFRQSWLPIASAPSAQPFSIKSSRFEGVCNTIFVRKRDADGWNLLPHSRRLYVRSTKTEKIGPLLRILGASDFARLHVQYRISAISEQSELRDLSRVQLFTHHRFHGISPERNH